MKYDFRSNFAIHISDYITHRRALGYDFNEGERILNSFDRFCRDYFPDEKMLTQEIMLKWSEAKASEQDRARQNRVGTVRGLCKYMVAIGEHAYILPYDFSRPVSRTKHEAYIYDKDDLTALFNVIDRCPYDKRSPARHIVLPMFYRLVYCCGLRPIEGRRLKCSEVDLETGRIIIAESKGHKDRMVVASPDVLALCNKYDNAVRQVYPFRTFFFPSPVDNGKGMYSEASINHSFKKFLDESGIYEKSGRTARLYDLRHTFATHVIYKWVNEGRDINSCLPYLCEYMGHSSVADTAYYIHLVPEIYSEMGSWDGGISSNIKEVKYAVKG